MAARRSRLARFRLPTILESEAHSLEADMEGISDGFLQCVVAALLVLVVVCGIGLWNSNVSAGHFADLRYVDTQINGLQSQMAALQLEVESRSVAGELSAIRDALRALSPHQPTPTVRVNATTTAAVGAADFNELVTAPPSTTAAVGAADYDGPVDASTTAAAVRGAADYQPVEPGTTEPDIE